jgi:hypothetical protein
VAIDQAATPAERQIAYKRVREELDGLISLSDGAIDRLEKQVALELTMGPWATPAPAPAAASDQRRPAASAPPSTPPAASAPPSQLPTQAVPQPMPAPWPVPSRSVKRPPKS